MSLLLILRKMWRYKLATLPVVALVVAGVFYVVAVKAPTYEASATYILVNPPSPPTEAQIARDPSLGHIDTDNPYLRYSDQSVPVQVLSSRLNSDQVRRALAEQGADPNYTAAPSAEFGFSAPILQITGTGTSQAAAVMTANLVGRALTDELDRMQRVRGTAKQYRITAEPVVAAHDATLKASGKLRALVGVLALGVVLMFIVISVLDALNSVRVERSRADLDDERFGVGAPVEPLLTLDPDSLELSDHDPEDAKWPLDAQR